MFPGDFLSFTFKPLTNQTTTFPRVIVGGESLLDRGELDAVWYQSSANTELLGTFDFSTTGNNFASVIPVESLRVVDWQFIYSIFAYDGATGEGSSGGGQVQFAIPEPSAIKLMGWAVSLSLMQLYRLRRRRAYCSALM
jgi:hypothetical protein